MSGTGAIVAGCIAPHPPHLVYAANPPQNEPRTECGWETLRWGYDRMAADIAALQPDVLIVCSPHWQTYVGHHFLGVPRFENLSVDPIFPNLFRFRYALDVDVALAEAIHDAAAAEGLVTSMMRNPDFRVDYGTLVSCHLSRPQWDLPVVGISSNRSAAYYSVEVMQQQAQALGRATAAAVRASGKRAVLLASHSLSHRHFTTEADVPEDMSREHVYNHHQYLWDMRVIRQLRSGECSTLWDQMPEFVEQAVSEADSGAFAWLLSALGMPDYGAEIYAYGTVIGTGNVVAGFFPEGRDA